jgi:tetratricopeptide (TPR) repeat protein
MSNAAKTKKKAIELEQKKQFDKALALYIQFLQESEGTLDDADIPLYNRVGDLMTRTGSTSDALNYYEKAVDLYADRGFLNNAIALCNKVLRQSPGRASIYYKLGKISATKGFKSDAKKNFLEYADRMQKAGQMEEAFRALKEFADLCPDQDDIRLMLAEQLTKENRQDEAMEQLQKLHDKLNSEGRTIEARATADRMKSIDPEAVPRVSGSYQQLKSQDLIFLDTSFEDNASRTRKSEPKPTSPRPAAPRAATPVAPVPAPAAAPPPPPGRQVSDPDLVVLTLADQPDAPVSPVNNAAIADSFAIDLGEPNEDTPAEQPSTLDIEVGLESLPSADELEDSMAAISAAAPEAASVDAIDISAEDLSFAPAETPAPLDVSATEGFELNVEPEPAPVDLNDRSIYASGSPLAIDYAGDLAAAVTLPSDSASSDLFDFRGPPRSDDFGSTDTAAPVSLDPDVAFPSFDIGDDALPSADEITSGASLAAALGNDLSLGEPLGDPVDDLISDAAPTTPSLAAGDIEWPSVDVEAPIEVSAAPVDIDAMEVLGSAEPIDAEPVVESIAKQSIGAAPVEIDEFEIDVEPSDADTATSAAAEADVVDIAEFAAAPTPAAAVAAVEPPSAPRVPTPVAETPVAVTPVPEPDEEEAPHPDEEVLDRRASWEIQREHAERLLEAGDRAAGVAELEQVAAELERMGDFERALSLVDELIRLSPDSIKHHQKRVELAFRSSDRVKLIDAYLELGDALFRAGEERKARAVYQRVLELAPDDPRAQAAVESVASISMNTASGSIQAINPSSPPPESRPQTAPRERVSYQPGPGVARPSVAAPAQTKKPLPLDRAAAHGDFIDLGEVLRSADGPKSTRMVTEEKPPTGDEQADFQEMLKRFKQGVAENVEEEDYESHYDLGVAYKEMGLMDEAVAEFQKALRGTSNRVRAYEALGQCFMEKEQFQVASSVLTRAVALGEGDDHHLVGVLYLLGRATEALDKNGAALDYYQRVFAVDIEFRDVAERISAIERKAT